VLVGNATGGAGDRAFVPVDQPAATAAALGAFAATVGDATRQRMAASARG